MQTRLLDSVAEAAEILRAGGLVAFPTETVFGLGADARSEQAIGRLFAAKGRPADNPLIVHLSDVDQWPLAARELTLVAARILKAFAPGPVTVVLPKNSSICSSVSSRLDTVGIRIPSAVPTRDLLRAAGIPIAAPSANLSGRPSCTTWQSVLEDLGGRIDAILRVDVAHVGLESSVVDCVGEVPVLLRPGAIGLADLQAIFPAAYALDHQGIPSRSINSPGLRHPHYRPRATVLLLDSANGWSSLSAEPGKAVAYCGLDAPPSEVALIHCERFDSIEDYAHRFYEFLRQADRKGANVVVVQLVPDTWIHQSGLAIALRERQHRAAGD